MYVTTFDKKKYPLDYTLNKLESILDPELFIRANRKYIINTNAIREIIIFSTRQLKIQLEPAPEFDILIPTDKITAFKNWLSR